MTSALLAAALLLGVGCACCGDVVVFWQAASASALDAKASASFKRIGIVLSIKSRSNSAHV